MSTAVIASNEAHRPVATPSSVNTTIDLRSIEAFFKTIKLIGADAITLDEFHHLIQHLRKATYITSPVAHHSHTTQPGHTHNDVQLDYSDFLQLLVAVACFRYPDPYTPLVQRVDNCLSRDILSITIK